MPSWPTVQVHSESLALPVLPATLDSLVRMTIAVSGQQRVVELTSLLDEDPFFTVWLTAQAALNGQHTHSSLELAEWMITDGEQVIAELDPDPTDELLPPDPEMSASYVCRLLCTAATSASSLNTLVNSAEVEILPGDEEVANRLMKLMNTPLGHSGPALTFSDWQKVLNWEQREQQFSRQLHHQKMLAVKNFAYGAGHEINNPLANISSRAQQLLEDEVDQERRRFIATIETQAHRASSMIADLMLFAAPPDIVLRPTSIREVIKQAAKEMREFTDPLGFEISVEASQDVQIQADFNACMEMFKAVIQNSLDAMEQGNLLISWKVENRFLKVTMVDNGPGIPEDQINMVFDPFFSGREAGRGIGFGLTKAWRIMQLHQGEIQVENRDDGVATIIQFVISPTT